MKRFKTVSILALTLIVSTSTFAKEKKKTGLYAFEGSALVNYGVPCALAFGVAHLAGKGDNVNAIGAAACLGAAGVTYYKNEDLKKISKKNKELEDRIVLMEKNLTTEIKRTLVGDAKKELVLEMKKEVYSEINDSLEKDKEYIAKVLEDLKVDFEKYKNVINDVLADKLLEFKGQVSTEIEKALLEGPFIPLLEEKMRAALKEDHKKMLEESKPEIIKQCVEDALNEIVVKEIGVPAE